MNLCYNKDICNLCDERQIIKSKCEDCNYSMCKLCYDKYIEYDYTKCPQCRIDIEINNISEQNNNCTSLSFKCNFKNICKFKVFLQDCRPYINLFLIIIFFPICYYIGYFVSNDSNIIILNTILGFILLIIFLILIVILYQFFCSCFCNI